MHGCETKNRIAGVFLQSRLLLHRIGRAEQGPVFPGAVAGAGQPRQQQQRAAHDQSTELWLSTFEAFKGVRFLPSEMNPMLWNRILSIQDPTFLTKSMQF
jgi:hypothetical protein